MKIEKKIFAKDTSILLYDMGEPFILACLLFSYNALLFEEVKMI